MDRNVFAAEFLKDFAPEEQLVIMAAITVDAVGNMLEERGDLTRKDIRDLLRPLSAAINYGIPEDKMEEIQKAYHQLKEGLARCDH